MATSIARLARAIAYPDGVGDAAVSHVFRVDGAEMVAEEREGRLILRRNLAPDGGGPADLVALAGYAAGRLLKEEAVLAWDPEAEMPFLWQEISADAPDDRLCRFFEVFATSVDWWAARLNDAVGISQIPEMMIRP